VLEEILPKKALKIALECGWLPEAARADSPDWRDWSRQLLVGRFSRVGLDDSCQPDPYLFVPFPVAANNGQGTEGGQPTGEPAVEMAAKSIPSSSGKGSQAISGRADARSAFIVPILEKKGWSILEWATESDVDFHTADNFLKGLTKPYRSTRKKLAQSLGLEPEGLPA